MKYLFIIIDKHGNYHKIKGDKFEMIDFNSIEIKTNDGAFIARFIGFTSCERIQLKDLHEQTDDKSESPV